MRSQSRGVSFSLEFFAPWLTIFKTNKVWTWRCSSEQWCRPRKRAEGLWAADCEGSLDLRKGKRRCPQIQYSTHWPASRRWWTSSSHLSPQKGGSVRRNKQRSLFERCSESQTPEVSPPSPLRLARGPTGSWTNHSGREIYDLRSQTWPASSFLLDPPPDLLHRLQPWKTALGKVLKLLHTVV